MLFTLDIFKAPEKRNRSLLFYLPLFSQKFTEGVAAYDTKGNVQII